MYFLTWLSINALHPKYFQGYTPDKLTVNIRKGNKFVTTCDMVMILLHCILFLTFFSHCVKFYLILNNINTFTFKDRLRTDFLLEIVLEKRNNFVITCNMNMLWVQYTSYQWPLSLLKASIKSIHCFWSHAADKNVANVPMEGGGSGKNHCHIPLRFRWRGDKP